MGWGGRIPESLEHRDGRSLAGGQGDRSTLHSEKARMHSDTHKLQISPPILNARMG